MRKIFTVLLTATAILSTNSCVIDQTESRSSRMELGYFSDNLVSDVILSPVTALCECLEQSADIFRSGFEATVNGVHIKLLSARDSTWTASNAFSSDRLTFSSTVKMLPDYSEGYHRWKSEGTGEYLENETYMARLETASSAVTTWKDVKTTTSFSRTMRFTGSFRVTTFLRKSGRGIDRCTISYSEATMDRDDSNYTVKVESIYRGSE